MSAALDQGARASLERFVQRARRLLEDDLAREAEGRFGFHLDDGQVENEDGLHLDPTALSARRDIVEILEFLRPEEPSDADAVARLTREATFTHLNRLIAIRIAEAIDLLPESLANGPSSTGFRELLEVAPLLAHDASGGYWRYLQLCGDELAADLPQLFDPRNPLLELAPSPAAFDELIEMITVADLSAVWDAPDALGWAYQFFNSGDERRAMREASASPRNSRELAVRNQFFTPRYVVDFLVHNSLGRRLIEANPDSGLADHLPLLLDPPTEQGAALELADVRVLDPACGSGHFLLGAYDVLERAWELQGVSLEDAAPHIVTALWGIDIDSRCAQVASAAVILRARRHCKNLPLPTPNIITARALPDPPEGWDSMLASLPGDRAQLVRAMRDALDQAPDLGPLLKVEELLTTEIRARVAGANNDPSTLFGVSGVANDSFGQAESDVLRMMQSVADQFTSGPSERLFAAEANDAIRFVEALRHRYDAVFMNPPFGEPIAETKDYLTSAYEVSPAREILCAFVLRGLELCVEGGYLGAITSRSPLFVTSAERWRADLLANNTLRTLADLGHGVMEEALVEAAAYVVERTIDQSGSVGTFLRLTQASDREKALSSLASATRRRDSVDNVFRIQPRKFESVPGRPFAYWTEDEVLGLFGSHGPIEGNLVDARVGLQTSDDFRFVRLLWEVLPEHIAHAPAETHGGRSWVPFAKGGDYRPFWYDIHLVVNWENEGEALRESGKAKMQGLSYFFRPGLTWPERTASGFSPRLLPAGCIFSQVGYAMFAKDGDDLSVLGFAASRLASECVSLFMSAGEETTSGAPAKHYTVGTIQKLPDVVSSLSSDVRMQLSAAVREICELIAREDVREELTARFIAPVLEGPVQDAARSVFGSHLETALQVTAKFETVEEIVLSGLGDSRVAVESYLDKEWGPLLSSYEDSTHVVSDEELAHMVELPTDSLVDQMCAVAGASKILSLQQFIVDRRLEIVAHGMHVSPMRVARVWNRTPSSQASIRVASDRLSYLVGASFGRWDVRIGCLELPSVIASGLFDPVRACPPGMLVGEDGLPSIVQPGGYPIQLPHLRLLVDEPGHADDIEKALACVARVLWDDRSEERLTEICKHLGVDSVREAMRKRFWKDHLSRYSKSRRKAPIYWPLTVPSGKWGLWVYAPTISRETLYAVASEALRREGHAEAEITRLESERESGGAERGAKALDKALDEERKLAEELRRFREEAERVAGLGWEPDLNDGIVLCAAPLADLFPQWKEPAQYRKELRSGNYEWSTVSKWADQL